MTDVELDTSARYCYLTTPGRVTGRRRTVELWFVPADGGVFLMSGSGGLTQWCLDLEAEQLAVLRVADRSWQVRAAAVVKEEVRSAALGLFHEKYDRPGLDRRIPWQINAAVFRVVAIREISL